MSESIQPDIEPRTLRAATEYMTVMEEAQSLFEITTQSGSTYTVDLREPACTCPDFEHRESVKECKHIRRVRIEVGQVDLEGLESKLVGKAEDLEGDATALEERAQELSDTANRLRNTVKRLDELADPD